MRRVLVGFTVGVALFALVLVAMDVRAVVAVLSRVDTSLFALTLAAGLAGIAFLAESLRRLRRTLGSDGSAPLVRFHGTYLRAYFVRLVLPIGASGAPAIIGYVVQREFDGQFEEELAVATAAELLSFIGSSSLALFGMVVFLFNGGRIAYASVVGSAVAVMFLGAFGTLTVLLFRPTILDPLVHGVGWAVDATLGQLSQTVHRMVSRETIDAKLALFHDTMALLRSAPRTMALALILTVLAWVGLSLPLFVGLLALGAPVPLALVLFAVPVSGFTYVLPVSGGLGGVEVVLVSLLVTGAGIGVPVAAAGVIMYRLATFWIPLALGGLATTVRPEDFRSFVP